MEKELYKNPELPVDVRVKDLLERMTLEEKVAQLGTIWGFEVLGENKKFSREKAEKLLKHGIGQITRPGGSTNLKPEEAAEFINEIQRFLVEETRLGIPAIMHEECLTGYMCLEATMFPQAIALASTWDPELIERMAEKIREDMRKVGAHQGLAPVLDVARDPRWGRTEETYGESPYLIAKMGTAYVRGLQGNNIKEGVIATVKHFVGYSSSEGGKNWAPAVISERILREIFLFPFECAVKEAGALSVMNAYNEIDGVPCASSRKLLTEILRNEFGFGGIVVSDYSAIDMLRAYHKIAMDKKEAARLALEAGIDIELPKIDCYEYLKSLVQEGIISEKLIDEAVSRVLKVKFMLGLFEKPYVDVKSAKFNDHRDLALEIARKSVVLLKNDGTLPIKKDTRRIAVIGPCADSVRNLMGDYMYPAHIEVFTELDTESLEVPKPNINEIMDHYRSRIPTILEAIKKKVRGEVLYAKGCDIIGESKEGFKEAVEIARKSDIVILAVGDRSGLTKNCTSGETRDSGTLNLPGVQKDLILEITKVGVPTVLVLVTGRPYSLKDVVDKVNAIVEIWFPGEAGGEALADVLFGDYNPGGKLPITFPRSVGQIPVYHYQKPSGTMSYWWKDYVDESVTPLFPFGHGLSYTKFEFSNLRIEPETIPTAGRFVVKVDVKNTGKVKGDEVVQLYVGREYASVTRPVKELKGFKRVSLKPGEKKTVVFEVHTDVLAFYDSNMKLVVEPGTFKIMVGNSSEDIKLSGEIRVTGERREIVGKRVLFTNEYIENS